MPQRPTIRSIPSGAPFLDTLVEAILDGGLVNGFAPKQDPLALAAATIYLPTRRSIRAVREIFLDKLGQEAALLPRLLPLGEIDEDDTAFVASSDLLLPDAVGTLERQIGLTRLILAWSKTMRGALLPMDGEEEPLLIPSSPGDAAGLAADLARFVNGMQIDGVPFEDLKTLTVEHAGRYDRYWDLTLRFLEIATEAWPRHLAERGALDPIDRRNLLLGLEAKRVREGGEGAAVIVAGSTGSVPATRELIKAVAASPSGAVVLPGLDLDLDEAGWAAISDREGTPGHPQASLRSLLASLDLDRRDIEVLGACPQALRDRAGLVSDAMRPAETTDLWVRPDRPSAERSQAAFAGVAVVEAAGECEEAMCIALALRETLEEPGRKAALVTPDRGLAARVVAELARWGIAADDSAGRPLPGTPPGILARLVLDVALTDFQPVAVLALLKHPFATLGLSRVEVRRATEALEIGALRGPCPPAGIAGLRKALAVGRSTLGRGHVPASRRRLSESEWTAAEILLDRLEAALGAFAGLWREGQDRAASAILAAHRDAMEKVAEGGSELYAQEAGLALLSFFDDLADVRPEDLALPPSEYPALFGALAAARTVRGGEPRHPRIAIYGLLEARLLSLDRLVLGGLDEGTWPGDVKADPWLNRPMRAAIGLSPPEKRIGLAAHDFAQALGAGEVVITHALKRGGSPTVPSRWLQRLKACLGDTYDAAVGRGTVYQSLARALDAPPGPVLAAAAPRPCPPLDLRPTRLSVTRVEDLVRDPYSVYARAILRLEPLDPIAMSPGAADRGTIIHEAVRRFADLCAEGVPADAEQRLLAIGDELFAELEDFPDVQAFWRPRFAEVASFLAEWEAARRPAVAAVMTEAPGRIAWTTAAGRTFTLTAQADRLEVGRDGFVCAVDFKTGRAPTAKQIQAGISPQLALEAAMLLEAGFPGIAAADLADPVIVHLSSGRGGCRQEAIRFKDAGAAEVASSALSRLKGLVDRFEDEATPYASLLHPMFKGRRYGDYDHLARVREWSLAGEGSTDAS
jgi:ATP-dependent helicase/nuclease subunit B